MLGPLLVNFNSLAEYTSTSNAAQLFVSQYPEIFSEAADVKAKLATSPVATMRKLYGHKKAILVRFSYKCPPMPRVETLG